MPPVADSDPAWQWGGSDGLIDVDEFRDGVTTSGVQAAASDIDEFFWALDADGTGKLDREELKDTLRKGIADHQNSRDNIKQLKSERDGKEKAAREAQCEWEEERAAEDAAARAEADKTAESWREVTAAEAAAIATKQAAAAEGKVEKDGPKAAREARTALKRQGREVEHQTSVVATVVPNAAQAVVPVSVEVRKPAAIKAWVE